jgi:hypothetical protein
MNGDPRKAVETVYRVENSKNGSNFRLEVSERREETAIHYCRPIFVLHSTPLVTRHSS